MKFIDEAKISIQSGKGGSGCVSFRREKFIPRGGPDGGDGGKGGDVIFIASPKKRTLQQFRHLKQFRAPNGSSGAGNQRAGKNGADLTLEVPVGTLITNSETGELIKDFSIPGETVILAKGGRGGQGNTRFKSSTNKAPRFAQPGEPAEKLILELELKLLADVGLVGLPNAGKSTLISVMSSARPKVADYPFTTLTPNLGVVKTDWDDAFTVADIPGLIEGAHKGTGLGIKFLRHIERTKILVHLIDISTVDRSDFLAPYRTINNELGQHSKTLSEKPQIVVLNKMDLPESAVAAKQFIAEAKGLSVLTISAATGEGVDNLKAKIIAMLNKENE
ncbi:MAG: GTPase ObgE [Desulfobacterales bacterium]|nr:GTPase ObgE [Desulfobacterales bacterium]